MIMEDMSFKQGDERVQAIYFSNGETVRVGGSVTKIKVVMESGQMAGVAWLEVYEGEKVGAKYNTALLEGVEY
jgi:hypothetical protein